MNYVERWEILQNVEKFNDVVIPNTVGYRRLLIENDSKNNVKIRIEIGDINGPYKKEESQGKDFEIQAKNNINVGISQGFNSLPYNFITVIGMSAEKEVNMCEPTRIEISQNQYILRYNPLYDTYWIQKLYIFLQ